MPQVGHYFHHIAENRGHAGFVFSNFSTLYNYNALWEFLKQAPLGFIKSASYRKTNLFLVFKHFTTNVLVMKKMRTSGYYQE